MACNKPVPVWIYNGGLHFTPNKTGDHFESEIPCGKCTQCRLDKSRERTIRCINEASMFEQNSFLTLTFNDQKMPKDKNLDYEIFKAFMKKLRWHVQKYENKKIRYYACGEYGGEFINKDNVWFWDRSTYQNYLPEYPRAHFHAIIFNYWPDDAEIKFSNKFNQPVYTSEKLTKIWGNGHVSIGTVTTQSCGYVARYLMKKQNSNEATDYVAKYGQPLYDLETGEYICDHPKVVEMAYGSSQPAIGATWLEKYYNTDCFNQGFILGPLPDCKKYGVPRYYWEWLESYHREEFIVYKNQKINKLILNKDKIEADNTYERQESKDFIINKQAKKLKRDL